MFFVKLLPYKGVRNGSFSRRNATHGKGKLWKLQTRVRDIVLDVLRAAWTPDAAQL
jgi:hypothetical protein